jgi:hypothetical protein
LTPTSDPTFERILAACLVDIESQGAPVLERACAEHPRFAARLRRRIELLAAASLIDLASGSGAPPAQLGDFELLEPLGA